MSQARIAPSKLAFRSLGVQSRGEGHSRSLVGIIQLSVRRSTSNSLSVGQEEAGGGPAGRFRDAPSTSRPNTRFHWFGGGLAAYPERCVRCASYSSPACECTYSRGGHGARVTRVAADGGRPWAETALSYPTTFAQTRGIGSEGQGGLFINAIGFLPFSASLGASVAKWQLHSFGPTPESASF